VQGEGPRCRKVEDDATLQLQRYPARAAGLRSIHGGNREERARPACCEDASAPLSRLPFGQESQLRPEGRRGLEVERAACPSCARIGGELLVDFKIKEANLTQARKIGLPALHPATLGHTRQGN